jgi:hypothetical protein
MTRISRHLKGCVVIESDRSACHARVTLARTRRMLGQAPLVYHGEEKCTRSTHHNHGFCPTQHLNARTALEDVDGVERCMDHGQRKLRVPNDFSKHGFGHGIQTR